MFGNRMFRLFAQRVLPLATFGASHARTMRGVQPYVR
jgi:hypothetical protein